MDTPEKYVESATDLATGILKSLGFESSITATCEGEEICLMIQSPDNAFIIGDNGSRLDDLQYLINRMLVLQAENAPRVRVDCAHYRERTEAKIISNARHKAEKAIASGQPVTIGPMNAYHRRLVHSALAEMPGVKTESENIDSRFKRITITPQG